MSAGRSSFELIVSPAARTAPRLTRRRIRFCSVRNRIIPPPVAKFSVSPTVRMARPRKAAERLQAGCHLQLDRLRVVDGKLDEGIGEAAPARASVVLA